MRAAGADGVAVRHGLALEHHGESVDILEQQIAGVAQLQSRGRVPNVGARQSKVDITPFLAERFGNRAQEGGDVVVGDRDVLVDLGDVEVRVAANLGGGFAGDLAEFGPCLTRGDFDIEPALELVLLAPDG